MPREIIDTQVSRPAYIRRNVLAATLVAVLIAVLLVYAFESRPASPGPQPVRPGTAHPAPIPGK